MSRYESVAVPFVKIGNRRGLTDEQLTEHPELKDFVNRFPDSFERSITHDVWLFIEPSGEGGVVMPSMKRYEMRVEDLRQYLDEARAENERLREALLEAREALFNAGLDADWSVVDDVRGALLDALSGKGETAT